MGNGKVHPLYIETMAIVKSKVGDIVLTMVKTSLWAILAKLHALYILFLEAH